MTVVENLPGPFSGVTVRSQAMLRGGAGLRYKYQNVKICNI